MVVQHRFPLLLRKLDPETSISTPVPTRLFHRGSDYSHPRNLYSHARNPYSHPPGIFIHIAPESVFTCPGIRTFIRLSQRAGRKPLRPTLSFSYRYREGKVRWVDPEKNPQCSEQDLLKSLKNARPDLDSLLAKRQGLLRRLCGRTVKRQTLPTATPKIGRNDPCPCGSGKKWKRCCGA